jgi:hypothetical protein
MAYPPTKPWKPARWGDAEVGKWNHGVNGEEGLASGWKRGWDVVELGAGALRKTAHLLTALADNLPAPPDAEGGATTPPIAYHALDLSKPELDRVLGQMDESYGDVLKGRVSCVGLHGDYHAGLQFVRGGGLGSLTATNTPPSTPSIQSSDVPGSPESAVLVTPAVEDVSLPIVADTIPFLDCPLGEDSKWCPPPATATVPAPAASASTSDDGAPLGATDERRPLHILFLGSSLGNFDRKDAAPFLRSLPMQPGDTLLLGLDGRPTPGPAGRTKVEVAYNDPSGHTRAFEENGWDVARRELGLEPDKGVEFVGRYNEILGTS